MRIPSDEIERSNHSIVQSLAHSTLLDRGVIAQNALNNMRNLTEHVIVYAVFGDSIPYDKYYDAIVDALNRSRSDKRLRFIWDFHFNLEKVVSHYTPSERSSERLLLRYLESLFKLRKFAYNQLGISILQNLELFPVQQDGALKAYYAGIADKVYSFPINDNQFVGNERYYINSIKPIVIDSQLIYELSITSALDSRSKTDRTIAFSAERIPTNNSLRLAMKSTSVKICGRAVPIEIIVGWQVSIRPCELNGLLKLFGCDLRVRSSSMSYQSLMNLLQYTGMNLCELCSMPTNVYESYKSRLASRQTANDLIVWLLDKCHEVLQNDRAGSNVVRSLLYRPRNEVIKNQLQDRPNNYLGYLRLRNECIPFDRNPFSSNLYRSKLSGLNAIRYIDPTGHESDILASRVITQCEHNRQMYLDESEFSWCPNLTQLIDQYNKSLYFKHVNREIVNETGQVFVRGYEDNISAIISSLLKLTESGISGYSNSAQVWLSANSTIVDDSAKKKALLTMFEDTSVAFVYGSAGTGKTTLIDYVCSSMPGIRVAAIANTNPAVESLRRRISIQGCDFRTVAKHLSGGAPCDLLVIDECSTLSNSDMRQVLEQGGFKVLLLVGDIRQIEAIDFGNWFELAQTFMPEKCLHELETPWRTTSNTLLMLWNSVRCIKNDITEIMEANSMSHDIDDSLFQPVCADEIVLCLNYDGLYGINNINLILQSRNENPSFKWGAHRYKVGDPILFNDSSRFSPLLYNNLKGRIVAIEANGRQAITFDIAVNEPINALSVLAYRGLSFVGNNDGAAVLRFSVSAVGDPDGESTVENVIPFQVAYAVSIHKAQGLEYDSVKVVVTEDVEEMVTHNIFYTAITRAKKSLRVYWTPETQARIIKSLKPSSSNRDACLIANRLGFKMHP